MHFNFNQKQFRLSKFTNLGNFNLFKNVGIEVIEENFAVAAKFRCGTIVKIFLLNFIKQIGRQLKKKMNTITQFK